MVNIKEFRKSKSFCPYPWVHSTCTTSGTHRLCCMIPSTDLSTSYEDGRLYKMGRDPMSKIWNSEFMKDIRKKMLHDEDLPHCRVCMYDEKVGKPSQRNYAFNLWEDDEILKENVIHSMENDGEVKHMPISYDLRLGNLCNLKCRMCYPSNSTQIQKENDSLHEQSLVNDEKMFPRVRNDERFDWHESEMFWDEFMVNAHNIKQLKVAGGEPMVNDNFYKAIDYIVDNDLSKNMALHINTNITSLPDKFLSMIPKFKFVKILPSIDGIGLVDEYIRYPSKWKKIQENFNNLFAISLESDNVLINTHATIQMYNAFNIPEIIRWNSEYISRNKNHMQMSLSFVSGKDYLGINILPDYMKAKIHDDLDNLCNDESIKPIIKDYVKSIIAHMNTEPENKEKCMKDFVHYTNILDKARNQDIRNYVPELTDLMNMYK